MMSRACSSLLVLAALGCAAADNPLHTPAVASDSAGIRIVENGAPAWSEAEAWRLEETPLLSIGAEDGPAHVAFGHAHYPVRLSDGRIVVADGMANLIHFYDAAGRHLKTAGGTGEGPGEFTQLYRLRRIDGDSLMALNPTSQTSIFSSDGEFIRQFRLDPVPSRTNLWWLGRLSNNTLVGVSLAREGTIDSSEDEEAERGAKAGVEGARFYRPDRPLMYRDTLQHFLFDMEGHLVDTIGRLPGQWIGNDLPYAPNAAYAFSGNSFYHSPGDVIEIREFTAPSPGAVPVVTRIIRAPGLRDPKLNVADRDAWKNAERAMYRRLRDSGRPVDFPQLERRLAELTFPERVPLHGRPMHIDARGNIWLQASPVARREMNVPFRWMVFDADGMWLGVVETPARFTVNEIGDDYILGIATDDLDVQRVVMHRLVKPRPRAAGS